MESDDIGLALLKALGFNAEKIPASYKKEADYLVTYEDVRALVEVKLKEDAPSLIAEREKVLTDGGVFVTDATLGRNETHSNIIKNASKQLKSSSDKEHDFKVLLFIASGINAPAKLEQFKDTIYGRTQILDQDSNTTKPCYFFRYSDFFRHQSIDGAIATSIDDRSISLIFLLNPFSSKYESLRKSVFLNPFGLAITDPEKEEKAGDAYILDGDACRKKTPIQEAISSYDPALIFLAKKYDKKQLYKIDFNSPEISIRY
jgi:hypothetical protein